jgi:hypothetical protein
MALTEPLPHRSKIEPINRRQLLLRTVDIERLVPEDDPVRAIWEPGITSSIASPSGIAAGGIW